LIEDKTCQTSFWDMLSDEDAVRHTWDTEWRRIVLERSLQQVRMEIDPKIFKAFELYCIFQNPVEDVCKTLDMSRNAVYIAKSRVLSRLRQLQQDY
jgi:RNA polymerase sigma-70 factor (ECF subfamily)